jgi:hypothetical protein
VVELVEIGKINNYELGMMSYEWKPREFRV